MKELASRLSLRQKTDQFHFAVQLDEFAFSREEKDKNFRFLRSLIWKSLKQKIRNHEASLVRFLFSASFCDKSSAK